MNLSWILRLPRSLVAQVCLCACLCGRPGVYPLVQLYQQLEKKSTKMECDYLYGWIKKRSQKSHPKWWTPEIKREKQKKKKMDPSLTPHPLLSPPSPSSHTPPPPSPPSQNNNWGKEKVSVSVSAQDDIVALGKAHTRSAPSLSSLPKVALETVPIFVWLNTDRSRPWRVECRPLPFSTPLSFRRSMLWLVRAEKVPQASEHLCPAKLQTRCDICSACQSICPFIPTDSGVPRTVDPQKSLQPKTVHGCVPVGAAHSRLHLLQEEKRKRRKKSSQQLPIHQKKTNTCQHCVPSDQNWSTALL